MTGRLQLIEQKLKAIDPAGFQNLCDTFLNLRENEFKSINRIGSQLGKQKTVLGTPDSFIRFSDGRITYIEYTTQTGSKVSKFKNDIDKCFNEFNATQSPEKLRKIIICFNSELSVREENEIHLYAKSKKVLLELIGIDTLAIEILSKYPLLSRDYLGIPIDTGQILPIDKFIKEYNNKANQLSTPIDNKFLHRKDELKEILTHLETDDFIILSGAPGVGKTKIGIEAVIQFLEINNCFQSFAISNKDADIYEDLRIQLKEDKNYVLLIDDANRQFSNLSQILGIYKEIRNGEIKIVLTVRNYALSEVFKATSDFHKHAITLEKFSDEEIIQIIESESFKIFDKKFQRKIVEISDGNVRLALMAARLANEKQAKFLWEDVSDLFDTYFHRFLSDFNLFENKSLLKTLGIISFFFTVNRKDKAVIQSITDVFEIDYYDFNEAIEELHKRELIEIRFNHARITEQVMATYFFYIVFIKNEILSFKKLLYNFFPKWKSRFKDSIIPANNSFGYENVITKVDHVLSEYLSSISSNEEQVLNFLDLFWFYKPEETLDYFFKKIALLPEPNCTKYETHYDSNDFIYNDEQTIDFISRLFNHYTEWFIPSIELGFEYVRKKPEHFPEFIKKIRESLLFDEPDERIGFQRQVDFINHLISKVKQDIPHYLAAFWALSKTFLAHFFDTTHGGRNHTIIWYNYPLPFYEVTKNLRTQIWDTLFEVYKKYPEEGFNVIKNFGPSHHGLIPEIMDFDLSLLVPFISANLSSENFAHVHYVQEMIYWNDVEKGISNRSYQKLKEKFTTDQYLDFCKLDWNRLRDKHEHDYKFEDFREYDNLKREEIKKNFLFKDKKDFEKLFTAIANMQTVNDDEFFGGSNTVDIVIEENFSQNKEIGFDLLLKVLDNYPKGLQLLHGTMRIISSQSVDWSYGLWQKLQEWKNENALFWQINFFNYIPDNFINEYFCKELIKTIRKIDRYIYLYIERYSKFNLIDKDVTKTILKIVAEKIDKQGIKISYNDDIFEKHIEVFNSDYQLIKLSYFQQYRFNNSQVFDYHGKGFEQIYKKHPIFLLDFLKEFFSNKRLNRKERNIRFNFIWRSPQNIDIITEASDFLIENNYYIGYGGHNHSILFRDVEPTDSDKAFEFILGEIKKYSSSVRRLNVYFDTIRNNFKDKFEDTLLIFLAINSDIEVFTKIDWVGNVGAVSGDVNFGDLYAKRWNNILDIVNKAESNVTMIPIKKFLKQRIRDQYKSAENERERKFLEPDW